MPADRPDGVRHVDDASLICCFSRFETSNGLPFDFSSPMQLLPDPVRLTVQLPDGTLLERDRGTPQGSPVSPVLANLFMHYAFDVWLAREFPTVDFERYADDAVVHCAWSGSREESHLPATRPR
jgi:Reverse transcriptase (RNA-dependent DNA polymerase)